MTQVVIENERNLDVPLFDLATMTPLRDRMLSQVIQTITEQLDKSGEPASAYAISLIRWGVEQTYEFGELEGELRAGARHSATHQAGLKEAPFLDLVIADAGPLDRKDLC